MKRVVITGAGTINALGHNVTDTLEAMREGRCGIGALDIRDVERLSVKIGGQVNVSARRGNVAVFSVEVTLRVDTVLVVRTPACASVAAQTHLIGGALSAICDSTYPK